MAKVVSITAALIIAAVAGTALTVGVYSAYWGPLEYALGAWALAAAAHLVWCGVYLLLDESVYEDAVESGFLAVSGSVGLYVFRFFGLLAISVAVSALVVHLVVRWVSPAKQKPAEPGAAPDRWGM
ncbi:hypothetical protein [Tuwongella immobilis]|uniref:Uncharacterized protein n=1 Tax=Tuwongella immobilis TaxID=692036 RepID=A0A6C2YKE2_9BACT|nr:hypothetical protein [Tuwongella immobilis]VIP01771.1 unnamed protein product [Tuwongella immobilis]VTR99400.1 unnamed protein product [Tuwongella immobilis]